jgi:hypothetical protein
MTMAKNKTTETTNSVRGYLDNIPNEKRRKDCTEIVELIKNVTGLEPRMWGTGIIGFGTYHYKYDSGHEGDAPLAGLASRVNAIVLYLAASPEQREKFLQQLGKHKTGKGCIYIQKLEDIDTKVLGKIAINSVEYLQRIYPAKHPG